MTFDWQSSVEWTQQSGLKLFKMFDSLCHREAQDLKDLLVNLDKLAVM